MGAGKTTLGSALATQLGQCFIDLDTEIERYSGCTVPELFAHNGELGFRKIEQLVLHTVVQRLQDPASEVKNSIIACGGGTPCFHQNLAFMKENGFVIYLEVSPEILCERLLKAPSTIRPLIPINNQLQLITFIHRQLDKRRRYYEAAHWKC